MPSTLRARLTAALVAATALTTVGALTAGCSVGPDTGPNIVRGDQPDDAQNAKPVQPELSAPKNDLNWRSCDSSISKAYDLTVPDGVIVQCAKYEVPVNPDDSSGDTVSIGAMKATTKATPRDAPPLVLTSGTDLPSSRTLLALADGEGKIVLDRQPVVAVDFRGTGLGATVDCLTSAQRDVLSTSAAGPGRDVAARATAVGTAARAAADLCSDTLSPDQLNYSITAAASDIEALRSRWDVDRIALVGVGAGSSVALSYAAAHHDQVGRLILDSPTGYATPAREATAARARGVQKSLTTFAQRCAGAGCALGADGAAMLNRVVDAGAAGDLGGVSDSEVIDAVSTAIAIGDMSQSGLRKLGSAIADADRGDVAALKAYVKAAAAVRGTDGRLVGVCNDLRGRPGLQELPGLAKDWSADAPMTAPTAALSLASCDGWGSTDAPIAPDRLPVDPLILVGANDPFNGSTVVDTLAQTLAPTKTNPTAVGWDGLGFSVLAHSTCAADVVRDYMGDAPLTGPTERSCPA